MYSMCIKWNSLRWALFPLKNKVWCVHGKEGCKRSKWWNVVQLCPSKVVCWYYMGDLRCHTSDVMSVVISAIHPNERPHSCKRHKRAYFIQHSDWKLVRAWLIRTCRGNWLEWLDMGQCLSPTVLKKWLTIVFVISWIVVSVPIFQLVKT